jgi:hypothetical protein
VGRPTQNLPRAFRGPRQAPVTQPARSNRGTLWATLAISALLAAIAASSILVLRSNAGSRAAADSRAGYEVSALLDGIPQRGSTLGELTAPFTLQIFLDLKDPDSRSWFLADLPAIVRGQVRTGILKLEYRAYKTNTYSPQEFVAGQTAALAAGAQNKLWNFICTFFHEQGSEFRRYATDNFLDDIARQVPGLSLARWHSARHSGRREEQSAGEDHAAQALGLHVTPSFRIGKTGGKLRNLSGHAIRKYGEQQPIALPDTHDIASAIRRLERD